jgi:hypothetical protein
MANSCTVLCVRVAVYDFFRSPESPPRVAAAFAQCPVLTMQEDPSKAAQRNTMTGLICVTLACLSSGFAGVYFEKILKVRRRGAFVIGTIGACF